MNAQQVLKYHNEQGGQNTLLVDDLAGVEGSGVAKLSDLGLVPYSLWTDDHYLRDVKTAVVSKGRTSFDLYRVLENIERFVVPGGTILILPYGGDAPENRFEATEIFLGVHPGWSRSLIHGNAVELRKIGATPDADVQRHVNALAGKASKRVISLALFGDGGYWSGVNVTVRAHHALFPGYELRIHHDDAIDRVPYGKVLRAMESRGLVKLVHMAPDGLALGKCLAMIWRMAPAWDTDVEYVFCRDLDSLSSWRDRCAIEEFMSTGRDAHTQHDAAAHAGFMGGLCGFRAAALRAFSPTFETFVESVGFSTDRWAIHGTDQDALNNMVRPYMTTFGHSLNIQGHNRAAAMGPIKYVTEIAPPSKKVVESVSSTVREQSDKLIPYLGSAGYPLEAALAFYEENCPVIDEIREAEQ